jgi:hypothetical protein
MDQEMKFHKFKTLFSSALRKSCSIQGLSPADGGIVTIEKKAKGLTNSTIHEKEARTKKQKRKTEQAGGKILLGR